MAYFWVTKLIILKFKKNFVEIIDRFLDVQRNFLRNFEDVFDRIS